MAPWRIEPMNLADYEHRIIHPETFASADRGLEIDPTALSFRQTTVFHQPVVTATLCPFGTNTQYGMPDLM